ncbi:unnamed protein product [Commensalibacter communis]|uniref:Uncharacterized protein n=1 Tax=Commensalibacter communis TaxID=2972786 RepID=A0A9W4TMQ6_9PROT|nr:DUF4159 domain-containing protein [Commensalibacter communis]CAI3923756.1 unnamed protein product [Commensalibacter communis]CAI3925237.1 unnamed protein product [Commensalibacter communis]CAI3937200.1 unnamed protein product [Commensalibacter communis]CAI3937757.1 unnamed protein product [Commensalibacter communis]
MIFLTPYILFALLLLPLIWFFLRATPPRPREQSFPPIRLLHQLQTKAHEAVHAPWWLILLRLLAVALLIIGLARPVIPSKNLSVQHSKDPILLVIDNGWASASQWSQFIEGASQILTQAQQESTPVHLLLTAPDEQNNGLKIVSLSSNSSASVQFNALHPMPWSVNHQKATETLNKAPHYKVIYYLSDRIEHQKDTSFRDKLTQSTNLYEIRPQDAALSTLLLTKNTPTQNGLTQSVELLPRSTEQILTLQAYTQQGVLISSIKKSIAANTTKSDIELTLPLEARNKIDYLQVANNPSAGSIYLLDENNRKHIIGFISASNNSNTPFTGSLYYLKKALAPLGDIKEGSIQELLSQPLSVIIAPDTLFSDPKSEKELQEWVKKGGVLIRFSGDLVAGSALNQQETPLIPLPLLQGTRELGGAMTWEKPQKIAPFPQESPFNGLTIPRDVTISKQVLVKPTLDNDKYIWAKLEDGTPLVTHRSAGKGQVILFHTNSTPDWSSLPLSSLFEDMLNRLIQISFGVQSTQAGEILNPILTLNGQGSLEAPSPYAKPISFETSQKLTISPEHPPGLYGNTGTSLAINLGNHVPALKASQPIGKLITLGSVSLSYTLGSIFIIISICLILLDILASLFLRGYLRKTKASSTILILALCCLSTNGFAQSTDAPSVPKAALQTRLGYILTTDPAVNLASKQGLEGLSKFISDRTSLQLASPEAVDPTKDNLSFYPILYWPITADLQPNPKRVDVLNDYLAHGGFLVLDTQGHDSSSTIEAVHPDQFAGEASGTSQALKVATEGLKIPALSTLSDKDLLSRTFYILHSFPGRYNAMPVWIAKSNPLVNDGVSSVIIGENDWAHAWATTEDGNPTYPIFPNTEQQRNLSYRFGLNLVMYALTGSYKADQVHVSALLKQLGKQ